MAQEGHESPGALSGMDMELLQDYPPFSETEFDFDHLNQFLSGIDVSLVLRLGRPNKI